MISFELSVASFELNASRSISSSGHSDLCHISANPHPDCYHPIVGGLLRRGDGNAPVPVHCGRQRETKMCGIVGVFGHAPVSQVIYDSLSMLQHRGQDAAGIATSFEGRFYLHKSNGLVTEVFNSGNMARLVGNMGIGHVRYPTAGCASVAEAQPFYVNSPYGILFAHNGNLTNVGDIVDGVFQQDRRHLNTTSDSEVMLNVFAHALARRGTKKPLPNDIFC